MTIAEQNNLSEKKPFFLAVAGNIGVGKTTLTTKIAEKYSLHPYFERVINNPYLADFYKDMHRWSFNLQVFFLSQRFIDQRTISESKKPCVQDRSIYEDAEIFAYILHKQGFMSDRDYENYRDLFYVMTDYLRKPDVILYLRASTWTLITRIRKRSREFEKNITVEYLHELNEAYERWIKKMSNETNVLIVNADEIDFEKHPDQLEPVYKQLEPYLS